MNKEEKLQFGNWQIGDTDINLNGILSLNYDTNETELFLFSDESLSLPYSTDVVYGKTYHGEAFTLYDCSISRGTSNSLVHNFNTKYIYKVHSSYTLEGGIFTSEQEVMVKEVYFSVTNLNKWAFQVGVDMELDDSSEYIITTKKIDDIFHINDEFELSICYTTMPDYNYSFTGSLKIETNAQLRVKFFKSTCLKKACVLIYQVRDFLSLCTNSRTYIEYISAMPYYNTPQEIELPIKIYGKGIEFGKKENLDELKNYQNYISLVQIKKDFNLCMKNWFEKNEKLKPVIELFLSIKYHRTSYERHFLNLVQALEAYHRLTRKNEVLPKEEHTEKIGKIIANVPEEYQKWVKEKLAFSNEPSLHERLEELLTPKSKSGSPHHEAKYHHLFMLRNKEKIEIIRDIKNTRNYNTHFDEKLMKKTVKGEELYQLISLLKLMLEYYLLMELEIDEEIVINATWEKSKQLSLRNSLIEATRNGKMK
ncbi:HEPN domain-containing protein [Psychrobacillus sp. FSL W7-1457]|uniref:HEPN domain-containing protein n=1 Tax=Psychrobacillus sp. FSL W7-1457 TaxID=2954547 RepID=UPI00315A0DAA